MIPTKIFLYGVGLYALFLFLGYFMFWVLVPFDDFLRTKYWQIWRFTITVCAIVIVLLLTFVK